MRRVIEPAQAAEGVIAVIFEFRVVGDLLAEFDELIKNTSNFSASCKRRLATSPHASARRCRLLQIAAHLDQRLFLATKVHRERATQILALLAQPGIPGFERHVFRSEQLDMIFHVAVENLIK